MPGEQDRIELYPHEDEGIYLFCLARPCDLPSRNPQGLDVQHPVRLWTTDDIMAIVSNVTLEEFRGPQAEERMKDLSWLGPRASRHEAVIEEFSSHTPVLPARFGTIFSSLDRLGNLVARHRDTVSEFLDRMENKDEWSVKGLMDASRAKEKLSSFALSREAERLSGLTPGMRYVQEQRIKNSLDNELRTWLRRESMKIWEGLKSRASESCERKLSSHHPPGMEGEIVLNWAFLVSRDSVDEFHAYIDKLRPKYTEHGLRFYTSGPWPPYSFCPRLE